MPNRIGLILSTIRPVRQQVMIGPNCPEAIRTLEKLAEGFQGILVQRNEAVELLYADAFAELARQTPVPKPSMSYKANRSQFSWVFE